jgi:hypothetical protein
VIEDQAIAYLRRLHVSRAPVSRLIRRHTGY